MMFWTLFGTSNQLLAALTLLGITVWLKRTGKRDLVHARADAVRARDHGGWALVLQIRAALKLPLGLNAATMNGVVGTVLLALAIYIGLQSALSARRAPLPSPPDGRLVDGRSHRRPPFGRASRGLGVGLGG